MKYQPHTSQKKDIDTGKTDSQPGANHNFTSAKPFILEDQNLETPEDEIKDDTDPNNKSTNGSNTEFDTTNIESADGDDIESADGDSSEFVELKGNIQIIEVKSHNGKRNHQHGDNYNDIIVGARGQKYRGKDVKYIKLYAGENKPYVLNDMQKCLFIQLKQAGFGDARACLEVGATKSVLINTYKLDPYFADLIKTYNNSFTDECEEVILQAAQAGSVAAADKYLTHKRTEKTSEISTYINKQKLRLQRQETKAKISALENMTGDTDLAPTVNLSVLSNEELDRYTLLYNKFTDGLPMDAIESHDYINLQQRIMVTKKLQMTPLRGLTAGGSVSTNEENTDEEDTWDS